MSEDVLNYSFTEIDEILKGVIIDWNYPRIRDLVRKGLLYERHLELKPCPFCGGKAELRYDSVGSNYIKCVNCLIETKYCTAEEAKNIWNKRK